ncbi:MAG: phosphatase PAP2 family protein [Deltaproteobacteria bacterium]|nr:phosphatase PAP2 family protein [Deltaproteobacteria bacterium]
MPFRAATALGEESFFLLFLPAIYWCIDRRIGVRLTVLFLFSAYLNALVKVLAHQPRPFQYDPRVRRLSFAAGHGLPSGHTQHAVVTWGYLSASFRRPWLWVLSGLLLVLIPLSRLYLGVHFPTDLAGGYLLGALILLAFIKLEAPVAAWLKRRGLAWQAGAALGVPAVMILCYPAGDPEGITVGATLMGFGLGFILERRYVGFEYESSWKKAILRYLLGTAVLVSLWLGLKTAFDGLGAEPLFRFIRYWLVGIWFALGAPWLFTKGRLL